MHMDSLKMKCRIFALIALGILWGTAAHSQYYLGVVQGEAKKIPITVLDVYNETGNAKLRALVFEVLQADLRRSEIFEVMDAKKLDLAYVAKSEPAEAVIKRAGTFGVTGVVWVSLQRKGGDLMMAGKLYDAASAMKMTSKDYVGNEDTIRRMVHAFADEIVSRYTGEKGVARTRIAYVSDKSGHKELYLMDYDGWNPMKITADRSICLSPAWSRDGKMLVYVSYRDHNPDLYGLDMETGRRWKISGYEALNISPAWSPDGTWLATASFDKSVRIWDSTTGRQRAVLLGHTKPVMSVAIAPDGTWLATASYDKTVRIWNSATGQLRAAHVGHTGRVASVAIAPDGTWLVTRGDDKALRIWNLATGDIGAVMRVDGNLQDCKWSPDGQWLAAVGQAGLYLFTSEFARLNSSRR